MEQGKWQRTVDYGLMTGSIIVLLICIYLLFDDRILSRGDFTGLSPVGEVSYSKNDVRRRTSNGFTWRSVEQQDRIYEGDAIFTGEESQAQVQVGNGNTLKLDPKSMVVIRTSGKGVQIDLQYGTLTGKTKGDLILMNNGQKSVIQADGELKISKEGKETSVRVLSGSAQMKSADGTKKILEQKPEEKIELLLPKENATLWLNAQNKNVSFSWKSSIQNKDYEIEIANNSRFTLGTRRLKVSGFNSSVPGLAKGSFYWRVHGADKSVSEVRHFKLYSDQAPELVYPKPQQVFSFNSDVPYSKRVINFSWKDESNSTDFHLEVATDAEFKNKKIDKKLSRTQVSYSGLTDSAYFWRVRGQNAERPDSPWSEVGQFDIEDLNKPFQPVLAQKETTGPKEYVLPFALVDKKKRSPADEAKGVVDPGVPAFQWPAQPRAAKYLVEIAESDKFGNAQTFESTQPEYKLSAVKPGPYFWRFKTITRSGQKSQPSPAYQLQVKLPPPIIKPIAPLKLDAQSQDELATKSLTQRFEWSDLLFAAKYEFQMGSANSFSAAQSFITPTPYRDFKVSRDTAFLWRVRALDKNNRPISDFSAPSTFQHVRQMSPRVLAAEQKQKEEEAAAAKKAEEEALAQKAQEEALAKKAAEEAAQQQKLAGLNRPELGPKLKEPLSNTEVMAIGKSPIFLNLTWNPIKGAQEYQIEIAQDESFENKVFMRTVQGTKLLFNDKLPAGQFFWRVKAVETGAKTHWSAPQNFKVNYK